MKYTGAKISVVPGYVLLTVRMEFSSSILVVLLIQRTTSNSVLYQNYTFTDRLANSTVKTTYSTVSEISSAASTKFPNICLL